jgi:hypothetical protein
LNENSKKFLRVEIEEKSLENLGTLDFTKFGQQAPGYTLLKGKINFHQKRIRKLNSTEIGKFG